MIGHDCQAKKKVLRKENLIQKWVVKQPQVSISSVSTSIAGNPQTQNVNNDGWTVVKNRLSLVKVSKINPIDNPVYQIDHSDNIVCNRGVNSHSDDFLNELHPGTMNNDGCGPPYRPLDQLLFVFGI